MASAANFKKLLRTDLRAFDTRAQDLILGAMERGGRGRISTKGHAILRSPNGQTMSVSRNTATGNRSYQNMEADFRRCFGDLPCENETSGSLALAPPLPEIAQRDPDLECPLEGCEAVFVTEGARYSHVQKEHYPCKKPGCPAVFDAASKASGHYNVLHRREELRNIPAECPAKGCDWTGTRAGLPGHSKVHPKRKPRKAPVKKKAAVKKAAPVKRDLAAELDAAYARIATLEAIVERMRKALS